jgi:hypothetical protein
VLTLRLGDAPGFLNSAAADACTASHADVSTVAAAAAAAVVLVAAAAVAVAVAAGVLTMHAGTLLQWPSSMSRSSAYVAATSPLGASLVLLMTSSELLSSELLSRELLSLRLAVPEPGERGHRGTSLSP